MITRGITFDASPAVLTVAVAAVLCVLLVSLFAWRKSGYDRAVGGLELLRVVVATLAAITLCQPEWTETYEPTEQPVLAVLTDDSLSMDTRDVLDPNQPNAEPVSRKVWLDRQLPAIAWDQLDGSVRVVHETFASSNDGDERRQGTDIDRALAEARKRYENLRGRAAFRW